MDIKMITTAGISKIKIDKEFRVSEKKLKQWQAAAKKAKPGSALIAAEHRKEKNPYLS
jgi:transposase